MALDGEEFNNCAILDEYEMGKVIGEGGFGKVHIATHKDTKKKVAVKFMDISDQRKYSFKHSRVQQSNNRSAIYCLSLERSLSVVNLQGGPKFEKAAAQKHNRALPRFHRGQAANNDNGTSGGRRSPGICYEERATLRAECKKNSASSSQ